MKQDIQNREDLFLLMQSFYNRLLADKSIGYLFTDIAKIDMSHHLPLLVDFWDMVLFQSKTYQRNPMQVHLALNKKSPLQKHHFDTWLRYFNDTMDELFAGEIASMAKERALSIATIMQINIARQNRIAGQP